MTDALPKTDMSHPILDLVRYLVNKPGWIFCGFDDPPPAPPGFVLETLDDGFLGYVTHYRHVQPPVAEQHLLNIANTEVEK